MASQWELTGTNQIIVTLKQTAAGAETLSCDVNNNNPFSILGGYIVVLTQAGGSSCDIQIGSQSILAAPQATTAAGTFGLALSDTATHLEGAAGADVKAIIAGGSAKVLVTLFVSQAKPESLA